MVLTIIYNFYVYSFCLKFNQMFLKITFGIKIALILKSLLYKSMIAKIVHLQNKTFSY
jgi:hypothetical protein